MPSCHVCCPVDVVCVCVCTCVCPFCVFSYDNFISMVADSMRYVGNTLGLDCVAFTMVQHLCQTNRSFVSDSGLTLEK